MSGDNATLRELLAGASNDYTALERRYEEATGAELVLDPFARPPEIALARSASVLIGVHNGGSIVPAAIEAIAASSLNARRPDLLEVIVVDDGSTDGTFDILRGLDVDLRMIVVRQERRGLNYAHNTALALASGDIVIFSDADVIHSPFALEAMMARHEVLDPATLVGFRFELDPAGPWDVRRPTFWHDFRHAFPGRPASICRATRDLRDLGFGRTMRMSNGAPYELPAMVVGAFFSLPRASLERMGGSEERLSGWGCEDSLIGARAIALGHRVVPVYAAASGHVTHPPRDPDQARDFSRNVQTAAGILDAPFDPPDAFDRDRCGSRVQERFERPAPVEARQPPALGLPLADEDPAWWCAGYQALGAWGDALRCQELWAAAAPGSPMPDLARGQILRKSGDAAAATAVLGTALDRVPHDAWLHCEMGMALAAAGEPERASGHLVTARELHPSCFDAAWTLDTPAEDHKRRGDHHAAQQLHAAAAEDYELALIADPAYLWASFDRGLALRALGRRREALEAITAADRQLHPQDTRRVWTQTEIGELALALGDGNAAKLHLEHAVAMDGGGQRAAEALGRLAEAGERDAGLATGARLAVTMDDVPGWLSPPEIDLLAAAAARCVATAGGDGATIVEIGSYCGRSTIVVGSVLRAVGDGSVTFHAIDPHEGYEFGGNIPTYDLLMDNLHRRGLEPYVDVIKARSGDVRWHHPIGLLFIDGLHDYDSVRADFERFAPFVPPGGLVAFHDYDPCCPDVVRYVNQLLTAGRLRFVTHRGMLILLSQPK